MEEVSKVMAAIGQFNKLWLTILRSAVPYSAIFMESTV